MQFKRHIALFMAIILLISNLGMTGYERYCGCTGKVFSSVIVENIGECCKHSEPQKAKKSCCNIAKNSSTAFENGSCIFEKGNCCDTKVKYTHLEEDAAPIQANFDFSVQAAIFSPQISVYKKSGIPAKALDNAFCLKLNYKAEELPPLLFISGRQLLQEIQLMRC